MSVSIDIAVFDGVDELDAIVPFEVLSNAARAVPDVQVRLVTLEERSDVTGACGLAFSVHGRWVPGAADILIVPGGGWGTRADIGVYGEVQRGDWSRRLQAARAGTRLIASVCTGAMLLGEAGLLQHRRAITHQAGIDELRSRGAQIVNDRVVDDGDLVTCGGVTSGLDLALWIVEREFGRQLADGLARAMEYQRSRPAERRHSAG